MHGRMVQHMHIVLRVHAKHVEYVSRIHTYIHTYIGTCSDFLVVTISVGLAQARPNQLDILACLNGSTHGQSPVDMVHL